ncbi:MAG: DUF4118 domain-containing protein [Coprococcus sp.]
MKEKLEKSGSFMITLLLLSVATGIGWVFRILHFPETNIVIVYILSVVLTARFTKGHVYGIMSSLIATCAFNIFFTFPYFTLSVNNPTYLITFTVMTITSVATSTLTAKVKQKVREAQEKEVAARSLYHLTNRLTNAENLNETIEIATKAIGKVVDGEVSCICFDED